MTARDWNPIGYRVHTNTWTAYGPQMSVEQVFEVLDDIDDAHFTAAVESLQPATPEVES